MTGAKAEYDYPVGLESTRPTFGGVRWWFRGPLVVSGRPCGRRAGRLYVPPGGRYFGCRRCHGLTYESSQEAHKYDRLFRQLAADAGLALTPAGVRRALLRRGRRA